MGCGIVLYELTAHVFLLMLTLLRASFHFTPDSDFKVTQRNTMNLAVLFEPTLPVILAD